MEQGTPLTENASGMKLAVEDESVKPRSISEPPATRLSQLSLAVPEKVPATRPVSCACRPGREQRGGGIKWFSMHGYSFDSTIEASTLH